MNQESKSDTPETDELSRGFDIRGLPCLEHALTLARKLERERDEARELCRWVIPILRAICHDFDVGDTGWECAKTMENHPEIFTQG
jgi:hypothetical protein